VFKVDDNVLFCLLCECKVNCEEKITNVIQHTTTEKHIQAIKRYNLKKMKEKKQFLKSHQEKNFFNIELCKAFIAADIPLSKLSNPILRKFLEKYTKNPIPDQSVLRKSYVKFGGDIRRCDYFFDSN